MSKAPVTVNFMGNKSYDPAGDEITYHWDFGDGKTSTEVNPTHTYRKSGDYVVVLTVTDGPLTDDAHLNIVVEPRK